MFVDTVECLKKFRITDTFVFLLLRRLCFSLS